MNLTILSSNIFQFFVGIEALGIISAILVGVENDATKESTNVFLLNKLASLLFLIATGMIGLTVDSFEFVDIKNFCSSANYTALFIPAILLTIACLCKGAQLPFSFWLLDAVKANTFVSILLHTATIVGIGVLFITKCFFIFDKFQITKDIMIYVGLATAFWMGCKALLHSNIKKIMACLTSSSIGLMFVACGIESTSVAILYFICHAFFKSMLFLSFSYVMASMSGERNILKMGGLCEYIPKITDVVWIAFLASAGFPLCVGFFAKISLAGVLQLYDNAMVSSVIAIANILSISAIFRMILISLYGNSKADDKALSCASGANSFSVSAIWLLTGIAICGSFASWRVYELGELHFEFDKLMTCSRNFLDYFVEDVAELGQILIAIIATWLSMRYFHTKIGITSAKTFYESFRKRGIIYLMRDFIKDTTISASSAISNCNQKLFDFMHGSSISSLHCIQLFLSRHHRKSISSHIGWIILGIVINFVSTLMLLK
jgi:NADH-quinone oxidoreductase subunit L